MDTGGCILYLVTTVCLSETLVAAGMKEAIVSAVKNDTATTDGPEGNTTTYLIEE